MGVQIPLRLDDARSVNVLQTAVSGMQSAQVGISTSAHNVANLLTDDFRPLRVTQSSVTAGGSSASVSRSRDAREVDLAREVVSQIQSSAQYTASLRVLEVGAELRGEVIDVFA